MIAMHSNRIKTSLVLLLVCLALFLRVLPAINDTVHFSFDQGLDIIMVKQLVVDHRINLISRYSGLQGVLMGPGWTWFLAPAFILSGGDPSANVILLSLLSVVSSLATYLIIKRLLGVHIAVITSLWTLFSPYFIAASQTVLSPHPLTYLYIIFIWLCFEVFFNKKTSLFWALCLVSGLFFQFEIAFAIFALIPVFMLTIINWKQFVRNREIVQLLIGSGLFILTFVPQILFDVRHDFLISKSLIGFVLGKSNSLYQMPPPLGARIIERIHSFGEDFSNMALSTNSILMNSILFLAAFYGWVIVLKNNLRNEKNMLYLLIIIIFCFFIAFSLYPGAIWGWYRQGLPIVYILMLTIPLGVISKQRKLLRILLVIFAIVSIWLVASPQNLIKTMRAENLSGIGEQKAVLDYIYNSTDGRAFSYYAYTPPVYDYIWQYDFWWYGQKKYGYLPLNWQMGVPLLGIGKQSKPPTNNIGLFYLIIEPDNERPWAPEGWVKSYIKIGKTLERKVFPSGVIVEKRKT